MSKGKEHKKYEFGAKASVVAGKNGGVILGAYSLPENDYDGHALEPTLEQVDRVAGYRPGWLAMGLTSAPPGRRSLGLGGHTWKRKENRQRLRETQGQKEVPPTGSDRTTDRTPQERLSTGSQLPQRPSWRCDQPAAGRRRLEPKPLDEAGSFAPCLGTPPISAKMAGAQYLLPA